MHIDPSWLFLEHCSKEELIFILQILKVSWDQYKEESKERLCVILEEELYKNFKVKIEDNKSYISFLRALLSSLNTENDYSDDNLDIIELALFIYSPDSEDTTKFKGLFYVMLCRQRHFRKEIEFCLKEYQDNKYKLAEHKISEEDFIKKINDLCKENKPLKSHDPRDTKQFLEEMFKNSITKYLTHETNELGDLDTFIEDVKERINTLKERHPNVPKHLLKTIESFAYSKNPEWDCRSDDSHFEKKKYNEGWQNPAFIKWYNENKQHPNASHDLYEMDMIIPFRQTVRVRKDQEKFFGNLIKQIFVEVFSEEYSQEGYSIEVDTSVNQVDFYTDTVLLGDIIKKIFTQMHNHDKEHKKIKVHCKIKEPFNCILFLSQVGVVKKERNPTKAEIFCGGDTESIKGLMRNLCNYEVIANYSNGPGPIKIKVLSDEDYNNDTDVIQYKDGECEGFTHVLKFY